MKEQMDLVNLLLTTKEQKTRMIEILLEGLTNDDIVNTVIKHVPAIYFIRAMPVNFVLRYAVDNTTLDNTMNKLFDIYKIDAIKQAYDKQLKEHLT